MEGEIEIFPEYVAGLQDLEGFSHIILIYHFHLAKTASLTAQPFMDSREHGVFAMRGPSRPNPIGISTVRLTTIKGNILHIKDIDIINGTPLLDIKPYVPEFDGRKVEKIGWLANQVEKLKTTTDDGRFSK